GTDAVVWAADYDPFGKAAVTTGTVINNLRFPGQYFDAETNLHYNYFRDYDPSTGRYIQSDPIGLISGFNTYLYANANPNIIIDPLGLLSTEQQIKITIATTMAGTVGSLYTPLGGALAGGITG